MSISAETKPCAICGKTGERVPVEKLPGNGILWRVNHGEGTTCEWGDYGSIENLRSAKNDNPLKHIECPKCGKVGQIVAERDDPVHKPDIYRYRIHHPDGKRHYVKSEHRDIVLKALGRYIESPDVAATPRSISLVPGVSKKPVEIICPRCKDDAHEEKGVPHVLGEVRPYVLHSDGTRHYMIKQEHKNVVIEAQQIRTASTISKPKKPTRLQKFRGELQESKAEGMLEGLRLAKRVINQEMKKRMQKSNSTKSSFALSRGSI